MRIPSLLLLAAFCSPAFVAASTAVVVKAAPSAKIADAGALKLGPQTAEGFNDPEHAHYFRHQKFLLEQKLDGQTAGAWAKLKNEERTRKIEEGEAYLAGFLEQASAEATELTPVQSVLLKAVWGNELARQMTGLLNARQLGDGTQLALALERVKKLAASVGEQDVDWEGVFDGSLGRVESGAVPGGDYTAPSGRSGDFIDKLESPEVKKLLSRREYFGAFLQQRGVPPPVLPPLLAMYDTLSKESDEGKQLSHILPTVVQFLRDGKSVEMADLGGTAMGVAIPGDYDRPEKVLVGKSIAEADPMVVADVLSHEFQHIYDMYNGRYYTLDSELRGFKADILFGRALEKVAPRKFAEMAGSDDDETRGFVARMRADRKAFDEGPAAFGQHIAFGHGYCQYEQGMFLGRLPLREAVDPNFGSERELTALKAIGQRARTALGESERKLAALHALRNQAPSRSAERELEKATKDVANARINLSSLEARYTIQALRLSRLRQEAAWSARKSPNEPYDQNLQVDKSYITP